MISIKLANQQALVLAIGSLVCYCGLISQARSFSGQPTSSLNGPKATVTYQDDDSTSAVIPSPNQEFGYLEEELEADIKRNNAELAAPVAREQANAVVEAASNEAPVPIYVSPFVRTERSLAASAPVVSRPPVSSSSSANSQRSPLLNFDHSESSHAPPNYAPRPMLAASAPASSHNKADLKTSASYGHHHHGGHHGHHGYGGYGPSGWLDMGAWTGGKGSFGWYADYPVGGKHHGYGYGK